MAVLAKRIFRILPISVLGFKYLRPITALSMKANTKAISVAKAAPEAPQRGINTTLRATFNAADKARRAS